MKARRTLTVLPTLVFEVGLLQSSERLEIDARGWIENAISRCHCLINRNIEAPKMVVREYELIEDPDSRRAFERRAVCTGLVELT